uniref:Uncharacterized protein n=1 Tax=Arundo donax TaxID=35708 RepID=A0A0A9EH38_ARUDO
MELTNSPEAFWQDPHGCEQ